ncbi:hypothetical protein FACS1894198_6640 [Clostridia bacterium]|nr:hypothetical protein FACS1894198_6640 [Clostridia bacterium]
MALVMASAFSAVVPISYAVPVVRVLTKERRALIIDAEEQDYKNEAPGTGRRPYQNQKAVDLLWGKKTASMCQTQTSGL